MKLVSIYKNCCNKCINTSETRSIGFLGCQIFIWHPMLCRAWNIDENIFTAAIL